MSKAEVFSYKGFIGAHTDIENGKFINDPQGEGQMGCVIALDEMRITKGAKQLLLKSQREGGSFASIMVDKRSFGLLGFGLHAFDTSSPVISRDCDLGALDLIEEAELEIPQGFIDYVDSQ